MKTKRSKTIKNLLWAFWPYPNFPYVLGGKVASMDERGKVACESFGVGKWFSPTAFLPVSSGQALRNRLGQLQDEFFVAEKAFYDSWRERVREVITEHGIEPDLFDGLKRRE